MGLNSITFDWFAHLHSQGHLSGNRLLEFGLSDLSFSTKEMMVADFASRMSMPDAQRLVDGMLNGSQIKPYAVKEYYQSLGFDEYFSIDLLDSRDTIKMDLNFPIHMNELDTDGFDVVANMGTSEHLFNPGNSFITAHNLTNIGGLIVSYLPVMGHVNHGFYNIHPMLLIEIAKANKYEVINISYIDELSVRARDLEAQKQNNPSFRFDFDNLPISYTGTETLEVERFDRINILLNFVKNTFDGLQGETDIRKIDYINCDMILTAFRKVNDEDFVIPTQF